MNIYEGRTKVLFFFSVVGIYIIFCINSPVFNGRSCIYKGKLFINLSRLNFMKAIGEAQDTPNDK